MQNQDTLMLKLDFDKFFALELSKYAISLNNATRVIPTDFASMIRAKENFRDNLFQWFIKMIKGEEKISAVSGQDDKSNYKDS